MFFSLEDASTVELLSLKNKQIVLCTLCSLLFQREFSEVTVCLLKSNSNNVRHTNESAFRDLQYSLRASADRLEQEREE